MISDLDYWITLLICFFHSRTWTKQETVELVIILSLLKITFFIQNAGNDKCINGSTCRAANDSTRNFAHARNVVMLICEEKEGVQFCFYLDYNIKIILITSSIDRVEILS